MSNIGVLWDSEVDWEGDKPSDVDYLNEAYELFSEVAEEKGAVVYLARFDWYKDKRLEKAYRFEDGEWKKVEDVELDVVFDKYKFDEESIPVKKDIEENLKVLNRYELEEICKDKLKTFEEFPELVPETRKATTEGAGELFEEFDKVVFKPRFSFGGKGIEFLDSIEEFEEPEDPENYILQGFIDSTEGVPDSDFEGVHDLRIYLLNGEPTMAYVRMPESGLTSNIMQGGSLEFVDLDDVPENALELAEEVAGSFEAYQPYLVALDTVFDPEGDVWIMELNSKPGLAFYGDEETKRRKRPTIERLVDQLVEMG